MVLTREDRRFDEPTMPDPAREYELLERAIQQCERHTTMAPTDSLSKTKPAATDLERPLLAHERILQSPIARPWSSCRHDDR